MTDINELVTAYLNVRGEQDRLRMEYEAKDSVLKRDLQQLEHLMLAFCNDLNVNSLNTNHGTVSRTLKERYTCSDWGNFYDYVREHDAPELLEKRIHQGNMKVLLENSEDQGLPPGVSVMREYGIVVRKPKQ